MKHIKLFEEFLNESFSSQISRSEWMEAANDIKQLAIKYKNEPPSYLDKIHEKLSRKLHNFDDEVQDFILSQVVWGDSFSYNNAELIKKMKDLANYIERKYGTEGGMIIQALKIIK